MKTKFILLYMLFSTFLFASENFYGKVEITMEIKNYISSPIVSVCCTNKSRENIKIPRCYLKNNYMYESYFEFRSPIPQVSNIIPQYKGKYIDIPADEKNEVVVLKPGKSICVNYSLSDFYSLPDDMYTAQIISYIGPLGYGDSQFVYFSENKNQYDFNIILNIKEENGKLIAELSHKYLSDDNKYYSEEFFVTTENLSGTVFHVIINGKEINYNGIIGDSFGFKGFIKNQKLIRKGDIIKTNIILNNFYDIPNIENIKKYKIFYNGYLGQSNVVEYNLN